MNTKTKKLFKQIYRCRLLYLMILMGFTATFIFAYCPIYGIVVAFKNYSSRAGIWGSEWVGLKHFRRFVNYPFFWQILFNTIRINVVCLVINFPLTIIFALMLNEMRSHKLKRICQQITYMPYFISTVVVCSMAILMLNRTGLVNLIITALGGELTDFMSEPEAFPYIYALLDTWTGLGWGTIIYLASLSSISLELIEAARIDGAGRFQVIWHVHLPHLKPTIMTLLILNMGGMLNVGFEKVLLLQNPLNSSTAEVISTYSYEVGIIQQQLSYSSAIGLFNNAINVMFIFAANKLSKKLTEVGLF